MINLIWRWRLLFWGQYEVLWKSNRERLRHLRSSLKKVAVEWEIEERIGIVGKRGIPGKRTAYTII